MYPAGDISLFYVTVIHVLVWLLLTLPLAANTCLIFTRIHIGGKTKKAMSLRFAEFAQFPAARTAAAVENKIQQMLSDQVLNLN